jgi:hypothetical protein
VLNPTHTHTIDASHRNPKPQCTHSSFLVKDMNYDGERFYDFAHTILQKYVRIWQQNCTKGTFTDLAFNY